jgi:hypothetical protein
MSEGGEANYFDGVAMKFRHCVGVNAVDRSGIVKIAAS